MNSPHSGLRNFTTTYRYGKLLLLLCFFACKSVFAQSTLPFDNFRMNDGLPSSEVYHVLQDSRGFMWFGTDHGVCRYDGYIFKTFTTADGLADNTIFECIEDYKGRIWFRSYSGKLSYYYHDSIFSLPVNEQLRNLLQQSHITSLVVDSTDNLYITNSLVSGFVKIDLKQKNSIRFIPLPSKIAYLINVSHAAEPLIGTTYGINGKWSTDAYSFISLYTISPQDTCPQFQVKIAMDKSNERPLLWYIQAIRTQSGDIAFSYDNSFLILHKDKITFSYFFNDHITKLGCDKHGRIWIATNNEQPAYYFNGKIMRLSVMKVLQDKQISFVTSDDEEGLWLTSLTNGIYYLNPLDYGIRTEEDGLPGNKINRLILAPDSSVWVTTSPGSVITIINHDTLTQRKVEPLTNSTTINSILFHKDNTVWISSGEGLYIYDDKDKFHVLDVRLKFGEKDIAQTGDGSVWINCSGNVKLFRREKDSIHFKKVINVGAAVTKLLEKPDNSLWLATLNGLWEYVNDSLINLGKKYPVLEKRVDDITLSPRGDLWIATRDTGLIALNKNRLIYVNVKNGLVSNFSHCLSFDYKGNLWVGTNTGLSQIILLYDEQGNCRIDSIKNTVSPNLKEINCIACNKNIVYVGTNNGLVSFDMNKMNTNKTPPPVYITGWKINNKDIAVSPTNLKLGYDENNIVINYVGLTYRDPSHILYRYRMDGIDTGWIYTQYTVVQYPKLPPGEYSFLVSARNSDGVWSKGYATVSFVIAPPFWNIWWVKLLVCILLILVVYWRIRVVLNRDRIKAEANQKLTEMELRELREQMAPHFLFNNLNTLSYLVESKSPDASVFVDELSKYFRYSLQSRNVEFTELSNELQQAQRYIHLLRIRYGDKLVVKWDIDEKRSGYFISNHSLQLLLENIIKHNVVSVESPLFVEIKTTETNTLIVKNNLQPKIGSEESTGLGLKSIDERYYLLYKRNIKVTRTADSFYVELPLLTPNEYESADN
ncbi:MAG TPA: two-component regulator propeller domain-containing protein [Bacteroidia bacterium]|nr:two-component regulator propeller domain-containing protein [Bacteroidia bacterium]